MKRRVAKFALFLLLGAIINVAVAWGCSLWSKPQYWLTPELTPEQVESVWSMYAPDGWSLIDGPRRVGGEWSGFGVTVVLISSDLAVDTHGLAVPVVNEVPSTHSIELKRIGWPWRCLQRESALTLIDRLAQLAGPEPVLDTLPTVPLATGLAADTTFYAVVVWLLFAVPGSVRRRIRAHRGRCVGCGYDLRHRPTGSAICPECGRACGV